MSSIKLRQIPAEQLARKVTSLLNQAIEGVQKHQDELGLQASCINCDHFTEKGFTNPTNKQVVPAEYCILFMQRPPARVIAMSCLKWRDRDDIPF